MTQFKLSLKCIKVLSLHWVNEHKSQINLIKFNCGTIILLAFTQSQLCGTVLISMKVPRRTLCIILAFYTNVLVTYFLHHAGPEKKVCFFSEELICLLTMVCESCKPLCFPSIFSS